MNDFIMMNWPWMVVGAVIALVLLWWVVAASRRTRVEIDRRDTLDEGADRAARNQALIDAAPAASSIAGSAPLAPSPPAVAAVPPAGGAEDILVQRTGLPSSQPGDDLTQIKGLGSKLATTLNGLGITAFAQIAGWSEEDIDRVDSQLGRFQGRIRRDRWVEQARFLASGDQGGFEREFGAR